MKRFLIFICALFVVGTCNAATLNIWHNNTTKQITLDTTKRTTPALAVRIDGVIHYANLKLATQRIYGNVYVMYAGNTYELQDNLTYPFTIVTTPDTKRFVFAICAMGTYTIDWGDGNIEEKTIQNILQMTVFHHSYASAGTYTIGIAGKATRYHGNTNKTTIFPAIMFGGSPVYTGTNIARIYGSLGKVFPSIDGGNSSGKQPVFYSTFDGCSNLTGTIPANLFDGVSGVWNYMFNGTFANCTGLEGTIPLGLFGDVTGPPAWTEGMFQGTFYNCTNMTGPTARMADGTPLYDWPPMPELSHSPLSSSVFINMYTGSGISD